MVHLSTPLQSWAGSALKWTFPNELFVIVIFPLVHSPGAFASASLACLLRQGHNTQELCYYGAVAATRMNAGAPNTPPVQTCITQ